MIPRIFCQLCVALLFCSAAGGQVPDSTVKNMADRESYGLFENEEPIEITLKYDLTTYLRKKPKDDYLKARIIFNPGKPDSLGRDVRLKTRGEFRYRECTMAPIELNFKKVDFGYSDLNNIGKLKLVTQCSFSSNDETYLLKEYLVYKLFNAITDTSFRVRLLKITFIDTEGKRRPLNQWGFFIEPLDMLTERTNCIEIKADKLTQKHIFPFIIDRLALFNYMAGNYDWSVPGQHNVKIIKPNGMPLNQYGIAIPYDFDWSGIVNASYARPVETTGLNSVRERLFLGVCREKEVFEKQVALLSGKKPEFYRIINDFEYITRREKDDIINFLETFFNQSRNVVIHLQNSCKNF